MPSLQGKVALVTGASRGVGKGIALGLGEAGAIVYITRRTVKEGESASRVHRQGSRRAGGGPQENEKDR